MWEIDSGKNGKRGMRSVIEGHTKCALCMDTICNPHTLQCMHHYCDTCLSSLSRDRQQGQSGVSCPLCKNFTLQRDIKPNTAMAAIVDWYQGKEQVIDCHFCTVCSGGTVAVQCEVCKVYLCQLCQKEHEQAHEFSSATSDEQDDLLVNLSQTCPQHCQQQLTKNCQTCEDLICETCYEGEHINHDIESVSSALHRVKPQINENLSKIRKHNAAIQERITGLKHRSQEARASRQKLRQEVLQEQEAKIAKIRNDTQVLLHQLDSQDLLEAKEITDIEKELEHSLSCQDSLVSWANVLIGIAKGPGLYKELSTEFAEKIQTFANEPIHLEDEEVEIPKFMFVPRKNSHENHVGLLETTDQNEEPPEQNDTFHMPKSPQVRRISVYSSQPEMTNYRRSSFNDQKRPSALAGYRRASLRENWKSQTRLTCPSYIFRGTSLNLSQLYSHTIEEVDNFKLNKLSQKMCYLNEKFWFPCSEEQDNCIDVYKGSSHMKTIQSDLLMTPRSLFPAGPNSLIIAAENGLFSMDNEGASLCQIMQGTFLDVSCDENYIVILERVSLKDHRIKVLHNGTNTTERCSFALEDTCPDSILLQRNRIYVCCYEEGKTGHISKYSITGEKLSQKGQPGRSDEGELNYPRICAADLHGSVLVADCNNCRLQVMDNKGDWRIIKQGIGYPWDVTVAEDGFMYILCGLYEYGYVQKCKIY